MRMSSPTLDSQFEELSQEDINSFDILNAQFSQVDSTSHHNRQASLQGQRKEPTVPGASRAPLNDIALDEDENPFSAPGGTTSHETNNPARIFTSFTRASAVRITSTDDLADDGSCSEEEPPAADYTAWFNSDSATAFVGFQTAASALQSRGNQTPFSAPPSGEVPCPEGLLIPSTSALRNAEEKMKRWQEGDDTLSSSLTAKISPPTLPSSASTAAFTTAAKALSQISAPETPTPAPHTKSFQSQSFHTLRGSLQRIRGTDRIKAFKSPLITGRACTHSPLVPTTVTNTPSALDQQRRLNVPVTTHPSFILSSVPAHSSPSRWSSLSGKTMVQKPVVLTPRPAGASRPKFVTPFKAGWRPHEFGSSKHEMARSTLADHAISTRIYPPSVRHSPRFTASNRGGEVFDLSLPDGRKSLKSSGLQPQSYSAEELEEMGINVKELGQITLRTALFYAFNSRSTLPHESSGSSPTLALGHAAALEELHAKRCSLATKDWVENHWPMVLWKLAGMVALDPMTERDSARKRWCWPEVIRQLLYRYQRDLNSSSRPPLRLITTRDARAESPMVLCVSDITWSVGELNENNLPVTPYPELEVTDGWYRLRARVDAPLARAIAKGKIKVGRKIAVVGAKLSCERKEGSDILEAYGSNFLILSGNSSHMAPWHAKLGFHKVQFIPTLKSLTADGGCIAIMMLEVVKIYPVAYIEFIHENGRKRREGPHSAKDEGALDAQWKASRELEASKLWSVYEERRVMMVDYVERLEQRAGLKFCTPDDGEPPDTIYDLYDTMQEDPSTAKRIITSISCQDAGWLARLIRDKTLQEREGIGREIERELESISPPRDVRAFCVLIVRDAYTQKHLPTRRAQLTLWDVPGASATEPSLGGRFVVGQKFMACVSIPGSMNKFRCSSSRSRIWYQHTPLRGWMARCT
ncbi:hypothetical protein F5I97DRAFT_1877368 [Phlebopus sp. FC_14]|nr:hypothetical protein F5I97DRAFT_1877368 [Phlebopus sp. FC_14]